MSIVDVKKGYISQAIYLVRNAQDKRVRYQQEQAEEIFGACFSAQSQQTNLPDDFDPNAPRLIFQGGHKQLVLSQVSSQLTLGFDSANKKISEQLDIIVRNVLDVQTRVRRFRSQEALQENALVLTLSFPTACSKEDLSRFLFDKFLKIQPSAQVASTSIKVGYLLQGNMFLNIEFDVYEKRQGEISAQQAFYDVSAFKVVEVGVSIKVDINNKPQTNQPGYQNEGVEQIIAVMSSYLDKDLYDIMEFEQ
ncbi:hypothetical protein [Pseudomonas sp. PAB10]|uniref:hypothetical protein n=1 Tax=Pseudomonas sp. PAB10 TaxID=3233047 RepID=UPI003F98A5D0